MSIRLENISKNYGQNNILKNISLEIKGKEFLALVGPSGCGKSTLLRVIAGLETPDSGVVFIDEKNVVKTKPAFRNLAMVFQSYALYPHLSVRENMKTPLKLRDLSLIQRFPIIGRWFARDICDRIERQVEKIAETLRLSQLLDRKPAHLSGGQRQRAALGRAMVRKPRAFLMDEPLSNLDAALRVHMRSELSELHRDLAATFVYVTHDQSEALTMADRIAVMMAGEIIQIGTPQEIYTQPQALSVAEFLGSPKINTIVLKDKAITFLKLNTIIHAGIKNTTAKKIKYACFRPEHIRYKEDEKTSGAVIKHLENLGSEFFVHVAHPDLDNRIIMKLEATAGHSLKIGDEIGFEIPFSAFHFFDADGKRINNVPSIYEHVA